MYKIYQGIADKEINYTLICSFNKYLYFMRIVYLYFLGIICTPVFGQSSNVPYVFYNKDSICIRNGSGENNCSRRTGEKITLPITFADHPEWNFSVELKKKLTNEPSKFKAVETIFAVSDIEGEFEPFRNLLLANKVIDENYNWTFGKGHLVICGDLFDRGKQVTEYLWLLYKLEQEAQADGGYVHVVLGNHDIMNLSGDDRYVQPKYLDEARMMNLEYKDMFTVNTELGRWLRTKNIIEKIGKTLFMHAGISPRVNQLQWDITTINNTVRPYYDQAMRELPDTIRMFFDAGSPFWYRGYFKAPLATEAQIDSTCTLFGVKKIVVGHTIMDKVDTFFNKKVYGIDVNQHEGIYEGLLIQDEQYFRVDDKGNKTPL